MEEAMELNALDKVELFRYIYLINWRVHRKNVTEFYLNEELRLED